MRNRVEALEELFKELQENQKKLVSLVELQAARIKTLEDRGFIRKILG